MAEQVGKFLTELPELETPTDDDSMYIVDGSTASKKITMSNLKRVLGGNVTGTVEGASVSFSDGADGIPMEECEVTLVPTQDLHGYSKPWAGGAGKNKISDTWSDYATYPDYTAYRYFKIPNFNGGDYIMSLTDNDDSIDISGCYIGFMYDFPPNASQYRWVINNGIVQDNKSNTAGANTKCDTIVIYPNSEAVFNKIFQRFYVQVESGTTATTYEPYSNICPISGHTDVTITVASTSGGSGDDTTVSLGRTVYGGTLDVATGELTVTHTFLTPTEVSSTGTSGGLIYYAITGLNAPSDNEADLISSHFKSERTVAVGNAYIAGYGSILVIVLDQSITTIAQANAWLVANNPQFCYKLATPQTFTLTKEQIQTLLGQNYVRHDGGGNIKVVYIRDLDIVINDLINRVTALENE